MISLNILSKVIISIVWGVLVGTLVFPLSKKLASTRTDDPGKLAPLTNVTIKVAMLVLSIGASFAIVFTANAYDELVRNLLLMLPIASISIIDAMVRKIPNPLLLSMIIIELVYTIYHCVTNKSANILLSMFFGAFIAFIVTFVPSMLHIPMGAGDIKYSGVIGLIVYAVGYFQAMIIMGVLVLCYLGYLKMTKKGGLKTLTPMGPFLSVGTIVSMCFSLTDVISTTLPV